MYQINDLIVFGNSGVCRVDKIGVPDISGIEKNKQYYTLIPIYLKGSIVYTPVDNTRVSMRKIITIDKAQMLIDNIPSIPTLEMDNEKYVDENYRRAISSQNCEELIQVIKTVDIKQQSKNREGKKLAQVDERYRKQAEDLLFSELAVVLDMPKEKIRNYIELRSL
ncbi:MAG: CarD family transcriptional regulator [Mobilitalea sp.]